MDEILLAGGQLTIASGNNIDFLGLGADRLTIDAKGGSRVFRVNSGATVTLSDLHLTGGASLSDGGGAILSSGSLTVERCQIDWNTTTGYGGGIKQLGGAGTSFTLIDSTLANNTTKTIGGAAFVAANSLIVNSTISTNTSLQLTGGLQLASNASHQIINSTVTANTSSSSGGGISGNGVLMYNSIVAANNGGASTKDINGNFNSNSANNLIGYDNNPNNGVNNGVNNNQVGGEGNPPASAINPMLGPLADNGGQTFTHALLAGSLAIDKGSNSIADTYNLLFDQRGPRFDRKLNGGLGLIVDVGAFEYNPIGGGGGSGAAALVLESEQSPAPPLSNAAGAILASAHPIVLDRAFTEMRPTRRFVHFDNGDLDVLLLAMRKEDRDRSTDMSLTITLREEAHSRAIPDAGFAELGGDPGEALSLSL